MNSLIETAKHLTLQSSLAGPDIGIPNHERQDQVQEVQNYLQPPLSLPQFGLMPKIVGNYSITMLDAGVATSWKFNWSDIISLFGPLIQKYRFIRYNLRLTLQIRTSWNKTGLVGLVWYPNIGDQDTDSNISYVTTNSHVWYSSPTYRSIARIGPDCKLTVEVPWLSPYASWLQDPLAPPDKFTDTSGFAFQHFSLTLLNLTQIRTIADDKFSYDAVLWAEPCDITVGGLVADPVH